MYHPSQTHHLTLSEQVTLDSSSSGFSFTADSTKPVPLAAVSTNRDSGKGTVVISLIHSCASLDYETFGYRESHFLLPFTHTSLNFFTLTFRALGRNHIASTPGYIHRSEDSTVHPSSKSVVGRHTKQVRCHSTGGPPVNDKQGIAHRSRPAQCKVLKYVSQKHPFVSRLVHFTFHT